MEIFSMDHGIKRAFDSRNYEDVLDEFKRIEKTDSVLYDVENYDTIDIINLMLRSQDWIDKEFIENIICKLFEIVDENERLKRENYAYYLEYGELEND